MNERQMRPSRVLEARRRMVTTALAHGKFAGTVASAANLDELIALGYRSAVERFVKDAATRSLQRLRMDVLPICLFHNESDSRHLDVLHDLKDKGLILMLERDVPAELQAVIPVRRKLEALATCRGDGRGQR